MKINLHGGFCCGIKHISDLSHPQYTSEGRTPQTGQQTSINRHAGNPAVNDMHRELYGEDFFNDEAPMEKHPERLKRMVEFIKRERKHHLIEVVIQKVNQAAWVPHLEENGFKMVTEFTNSNTSYKLQVWHLAY